MKIATTHNAKQTATLSARIPESLDMRLNALIEKTHRSKGYFVRHALERYLEDEEDLADAIASYEEHLRLGKKGLSMVEMKKKYDLE